MAQWWFLSVYKLTLLFMKKDFLLPCVNKHRLFLKNKIKRGGGARWPNRTLHWLSSCRNSKLKNYSHKKAPSWKPKSRWMITTRSFNIISGKESLKRKGKTVLDCQYLPSLIPGSSSGHMVWREYLHISGRESAVIVGLGI